VQRESVKASAFYRAGGRRGRRWLQWPAMKAPVTRSEEGGGCLRPSKSTRPS
jgi:hypothetical protein